jgi:hypothetical protein
MSSIPKLLNTEASKLAAVLRYGLMGLRAALDAAGLDHPGDPGAAACREVVAELDDLVGQLSTTPVAAKENPLDTTTRELLTLSSAPKWLPGQDAELPPAVLWQRLHLATLRLPDSDKWRQAVTRAPVQAGDTAWNTLPGKCETLLVPPFEETAGWRTAPGGKIDDEVRDQLGITAQPVDPHRAELAELATTLLAMTTMDTELLVGLESVQYKGLGRLDETLRTAYRQDLLDRLAAYGRTAYGSPESFEALLLVDEALHSLLHIPPAAPGSWWAKLQEQARAVVFRAQRDHTGVQIQLLAQPYREARAMTGGNDVRARHDGSGVVLRCLRLWAEVNGKRLPGRVVYAG